jgi:DNA-binding MarR family transcriptional regulator
MDDASLVQELLRALRRSPDRNLNELAEAVGLSRTNFGRPLGKRLREPVERLRAEGLVEERRGRYRLSEQGRHALAQRALDSGGHA